MSLCSFNSSYSQQLIPGLDLLQGKKKVEIPFEYRGGYLLLNVEIQGALPMRFIYDTGAEHTIFFEKHITDLLGFEYSNSVKIRGSDINTTIPAFISRNIYIQPEGLVKVKRDIVVLEENFLNLKEMTGLQIDGILGSSFFQNLTMEIDFKKLRLVLWHPDKFDKKLNGYSKQKIDIIDNKPYIKCITQKPSSEEFELKLLIDTGASLSFLINTNSNTALTPPELATPGKLGKGIGGFISGYKGKMKSLEFGNHTFDNILTHFQEINEGIDANYYNDRNGLIGTTLLERFSLIINYLGKEIYLKPNRRIDRKFKYNLSGMEVFAFGVELNSFIVFDVLPGSPAEEAGIKVGDVVKKVGLFTADKFTLTSLDKKLSKRPGKKIKLKIIREEEKELDIEFTLKDYLLG